MTCICVKRLLKKSMIIFNVEYKGIAVNLCCFIEMRIENLIDTKAVTFCCLTCIWSFSMLSVWLNRVSVPQRHVLYPSSLLLSWVIGVAEHTAGHSQTWQLDSGNVNGCRIGIWDNNSNLFTDWTVFRGAWEDGKSSNQHCMCVWYYAFNKPCFE